MTAPTDVEAFQIMGVGGFIVRTSTGVERVLEFLLPSGRVISFALDADQLKAVGSKVTELQLAEMETGEAMRDLGVYEQG